jgi:hypothetical protein
MLKVCSRFKPILTIFTWFHNHICIDLHKWRFWNFQTKTLWKFQIAKLSIVLMNIFPMYFYFFLWMNFYDSNLMHAKNLNQFGARHTNFLTKLIHYKFWIEIVPTIILEWIILLKIFKNHLQSSNSKYWFFIYFFQWKSFKYLNTYGCLRRRFFFIFSKHQSLIILNMWCVKLFIGTVTLHLKYNQNTMQSYPIF